MKHKYSSWIREAAAQIDTLQVPRRRLEELGWTDFHADPPDATEHLHEFASLAVELCCFDEEGRWGRQEELMFGIVAATEAVSSLRVSPEELSRLARLVVGGDRNMDEIRFWFQVNFPPPKQ